MNLSAFHSDEYDWDKEPKKLIINKNVKSDKNLPYEFWFENLVRACILNYLEEQIEEEKTD